MSDQKPDEQHRRWWILPAILLAATVLRGFAAWHWQADLHNDRDAYLAIADSLLRGDGFSIDGERPTALRPPLYPAVLAVAELLGGTLGIAILQVLLGVATVYLTFRLGRSLLSPTCGLIAAALVAVDPLLLRYTPQLMTETLFTFLVVLLLCQLSRQQTHFRAAMIGVLFAFCALCRPTIWAWAALMAGWWMVDLWRRPLSRKRQLWTGGLIAAAVVIAVSPWVVRNTVQFDRPIVMTTHGGYTLLLGNNAVFYDEVVRQPWGTTWDGESLREWQWSLEADVRSDDSVEAEVVRDRRLFWRGVENIRDDWAGFFAACWLRLRRFWNITPTGHAAGGLSPAVVWATGLFYAVIFTAACFGLYRLRKVEWSSWLPLVLVIVAFTAVHSVYWSNARMRSPLVPIVALLAARAVCCRREAGVRAKR